MSLYLPSVNAEFEKYMICLLGTLRPHEPPAQPQSWDLGISAQLNVCRLTCRVADRQQEVYDTACSDRLCIRNRTKRSWDRVIVLCAVWRISSVQFGNMGISS
jgi:hypothetical protein